jgi:hypothetical protein
MKHCKVFVSAKALSITTLNITALSITTLSITTLGLKGLYMTLSINDTHHNMLNIIMLSVTFYLLLS